MPRPVQRNSGSRYHTCDSTWGESTHCIWLIPESAFSIYAAYVHLSNIGTSCKHKVYVITHTKQACVDIVEWHYTDLDDLDPQMNLPTFTKAALDGCS